MKKYERRIGIFFEKPEKADIILFTHHHADHCYPSSFIKMHKKNTIYIGPEKCFQRIGSKLRIIKSGENIVIDGIIIKAVDAYNLKKKRSSGQLWHPKDLGIGYLITIEEKTIYHAGDTELISEMKKFGDIDVALLPIDGKFTMNIEEAIEAANVINPKIVIPMHNHEASMSEFKQKLEVLSNIDVKTLDMGGTLEI